MVLRGVDPKVVLDICSRSILFWESQIMRKMSMTNARVRAENDHEVQRRLEELKQSAAASEISRTEQIDSMLIFVCLFVCFVCLIYI